MFAFGLHSASEYTLLAYYNKDSRNRNMPLLFGFPIFSSFAQRFYHWAISISVSLWRTTDWLRPTICRPTAPAGLRHGF